MSVPGVAAFHDAGGSGSGDGLEAGSGTAIADNQAVRGDTPSGLQGSGVTISDAAAVSGVTQLDVDNLRLDGNVLSATNANGGVMITPNGTGKTLVSSALQIGGTTGSHPALVNSGASLQAVRANDSSTFTTLDLETLTAAPGGAAKVRVGSGISLGASVLLGWSSNANPNYAGTSSPADLDTAQARVAAGVVLDTNSTGGLAARLTGRVVEANTAVAASPNVLLATESRKLLTNEGATAEAYHTLPAAAAGIEFVFYCQDTDGIRVVANAGETIRIGANVSAAAGFVRSLTVGSALQLVAINATEWVAISVSGTWTIDV
jgi:hypothetical protein